MGIHFSSKNCRSAENFCNEIASQNLDTLNFKRFKFLPLACSHRQRNTKTNFFRCAFILPLHKTINVGQVYRYFVKKKKKYLSSTQKLAKAATHSFCLIAIYFLNRKINGQFHSLIQLFTIILTIHHIIKWRQGIQ